ncbi:hypothetical protein PLESTF_001113300 [Pleodorina starrii]|nr:hypothetical protein PLESTF_001113300 [Pleodorina starrii]
MAWAHLPATDALQLVGGDEVRSRVFVFQGPEVQAKFQQGLYASEEEREILGLGRRVVRPDQVQEGSGYCPKASLVVEGQDERLRRSDRIKGRGSLVFLGAPGFRARGLSYPQAPRAGGLELAVAFKDPEAPQQ